MKKLGWIILFFMVISILTGCTDLKNDFQVQLEDSQSHQIDIQYDMEQVLYREEAASYTAEAYCPSAQLLSAVLLERNASAESNAFGKIYYVYDGEILLESLNVYERGSEVGMYGGFFYHAYAKGQDKFYQDVIDCDSYHASVTDQIARNRTRDIYYEKDKELEFQSLGMVCKEFESLFSELLVDNVQINAIYAMDLDTMNEQATIANTNQWSVEDEAYYVEFEQVVDGIPLANHMWSNSTRSIATETVIWSFFSKNGVQQLKMVGAIDNVKIQETKPILSPSEAEAIMINLYRSTSLVSNVAAEEMQLNYIVLNNEDEFRLIPAYIFCISIENYVEDPQGGEPVAVKSYQHCVIDAYTGEYVLGATY